MMVLGITGPTGSGKTTALDVIREMGGCVLDLDAVYHDLLKSSGELLGELDTAFPGVVQDNELNRKALGSIVFSDQQALRKLNAITGKYILAETDRRLDEARAGGLSLAAIDAINLLEGDLPERCQETIAVTAPVEVRVRRLMERDHISEEYARLRISAQQPNAFFEEHCGYTLRNGEGSREEFAQRCRELFASLLAGKEHGHE